jgi:putative transposase
MREGGQAVGPGRHDCVSPMRASGAWHRCSGHPGAGDEYSSPKVQNVSADSTVQDLASIDFFTIPTATFRVLYVFLVLSHDRRRVVHFNVTSSPTSAWTGQQILEAFPWDTAPKYLLRDRDGIYRGAEFKGAVKSTGAQELKSAPRSPWQNPFVERLIGSIRRECLDHVIVFNEQHLQRLLAEYFDYYHRSRTHLSLDKDAPETRAVELPENGPIRAVPLATGYNSVTRERPRDGPD